MLLGGDIAGGGAREVGYLGHVPFSHDQGAGANFGKNAQFSLAGLSVIGYKYAMSTLQSVCE
jgi:hypothetical protein